MAADDEGRILPYSRADSRGCFMLNSARNDTPRFASREKLSRKNNKLPDPVKFPRFDVQ